MKKDDLEKLISKKIDDIEVYISEVNEVKGNVQLLSKILADKTNDIIQEDGDVYSTEEYEKYSVEVVRLNILMKETNSLLIELIYMIKTSYILGIEFSEEFINLIASKEYIDVEKSLTSDNIFVINRLKKLEEKEKGLFDKILKETLESDVVKNTINGLRKRDTNSN